MTLTVNDTILDEEFRTIQTGAGDDDDTSALGVGVQALIDGVSDPGDFFSAPTGFPQVAVNSDFYTSDQAVKDLFLTSDANGTDFPAGGVPTDLYVGTEQISLYASGNDNVVFGRIGGADGDIVLIIAVDETKDSDGFVTGASLWMVQYAPIVDHLENLVDVDDFLDLDDLIYLGSDFDTTTEVPFENFASVKSGQDAFAPVADTDPNSTADVQLLITGFAGSTVGTVNVSTAGLGTNAQHVDKLESLRVDIVGGLDTSGALDSTFVHDAANISYDNHVNAISATFEIEQLNPTNTPATCSVFAFQDEDTDAGGPDSEDYQGTLFPTKAISDPGTAVQIDAADVIILDANDNDITQDFLDRGGTIVADGMGVKITGLLAHEQVSFSTDNEEFDRFVVTNTSTIKGPSTFDLGEIHVTVIEGGTGTEFADLGEHLIYEDDGPNIDASGDTPPTLTVDDSAFATDATDDYSGLFDDPDYGADGAGHVDYTLDVSAAGALSGLTDTASGNDVFLFLEGDDVVGREGTDATDAETGDEVFRITVDADGNVTLDQSRAVVHGDPDDPDETSPAMTASLITLTATAYDSEPDDENDSDSASVDIGDTFFFKDDGPEVDDATFENLLVDNTVPGGGDSDSGDFDFTSGNDLLGDVTIIGAPDSNGFTFDFDDADHQSITGQYNNEDLYTLTVDDDGGYVFTMIGELAATEDHLDTNDIKAGGPDTNFITVGTTNTTDYCKLSGYSGGNTPVPAAINESNANVGVKNGNLDNGEAIKFELFDENDELIYFLGLNIGTKSAKASDYKIDIDFVDPSVSDITGMLVHVDKNGTLMINPTGDDLIQSITVHKETGPALKLGLGDIDILRPPGDFELTFELNVTDGDDDHDSGTFVVQIDGNGGGIDDPILV